MPDSPLPPVDEGDTIVALSTPPGTGAIGLVRLSGPRAIEIGRRVFVPGVARSPEERDPAAGPSAVRAGRDPFAPDESHRLVYGHVVDPEGPVLDEVLLVAMRAPATYTREDVVEVHCHGGVAAQRAVLRLLCRLGARPAEPGEFTRRAFLHGRIDLAQAESVAGIVQARTEVALRAAVRQLEGGLSGRLREVRRSLVGALAQVEATIDFSDEDIETLDRPLLEVELEQARAALERLLATAFLGRMLQQGVRTAIVGKPNVGKSSLLNALLMRERAIVSAIPGTTRDTVEELTEIGGIPLHLVDTAGLRPSEDAVERLGIERSRRAMEEADLVLAVFDASEPLNDEDRTLLELLPDRTCLLVANKVDLASPARRDAARAALLDASRRHRERVGAEGGADAVLLVSAASGEGLDRLRSAITETVLGERAFHLDEPLVATERQRLLVDGALEAVREALASSREGTGEELVCEDLRSAIGQLGAVTGEELVPDLLDEVFSRFCIGK